jgi:hypothetical protein
MSTYPASRRPPTPPPSPDHDGIAGRIGPEPDAYDALADMFLGELSPQDSAAPSPAASRSGGLSLQQPVSTPAAGERPGVELLILGHLPIMAAAWASHYVRHAAMRLTASGGAPVASLRLAEHAAWLELINAPETTTPAATLNAALRAASVAQHWIIRTEPGRERRLADHQRLSHITLLTGSNEAATVDAYRAIKQLVAEGGADRLPTLRVAVLGGSAAACRQAADRICDACHAFLEIEIEVVTCPGAIGSGPGGVELYHGPMHADERLVLDRIAEIRRPGDPAETSTPERQPIPITQQVEASPEGLDATATPESGPTPTDPAPEAELPRPEDLGLRPIVAACPYEPSVQLAMDEAGGLHLLVQARESSQIDAAVRALSIVSAWASDHRSLLGAAGVREQGPIQRHLLTGAPREARRLLDTDIRIHLWASAARAQHGWVLADLN